MSDGGKRGGALGTLFKWLALALLACLILSVVAVLALCAPEASAMTGETLAVAGGEV